MDSLKLWQHVCKSVSLQREQKHPQESNKALSYEYLTYNSIFVDSWIEKLRVRPGVDTF